MDNWMRALDAGDIVSAGDIAKKALHGALSGGPGEGLSELGNELADQAIMGELSNWNTTVQAYRDGGMSEAAAKRMAARDVWGRVGSATFTGMISEGATGAAAATRSYARNNAAANAAFANNANMGPIDYRWGDDAETARPAAPEAPANDEYDIGLPMYDENGDLIPEEERRPWQPQTPMADPATLGEDAMEQQEPQPKENEGVDAWKEETETGENEADDYDIGMPMYDENGNLIPEEERRPWQPEERTEAEQQPAAAEEAQNAEESQQEGQQEAEQAEGEQEEGTEERRGGTPENAENGHALDQRRDAVIVNEDGSVTQASVVGVESVSDGRVLMRMENADGDTELVDAAELDFADESTQDLMSYEGLARLNAQGVQGYLNNYDAQKAAPADYARAYNRIYQRAASGLDFNRAAGHDLAAMAYMTKAAKEAAYNAGRAVFQTRTDRYAKTEQTSAFQRTVLDALNKVTGGKIRMTDEDIGGNGYYDPKTGEIVISSKAEKGAYAYVAVHEMAHKMQAENAKAWGEFSRMVQDALKNNGVDIDAAMRHVQQLYQKQGMELDAEDALEEVICNSAASILQDADVVRDLVQRNRSVMERVADFLREWLDKLTGSMQKTGEEMSQLESWKQMKALKGDHAAMQKMYETLVGALEEANEQESQQDKKDVKLNVKEEGYYDYSKPFAEQIEDLLEGRFPERNALLVSGTPEVLQKIGFSNLPLTINQDHLLRMERDTEHYLSKELIRQFPELLKDPVAVITSEGNSDSSTVMILKATVNGKPYIAPVYITSESISNNARIDSNNIATVFRKGNAVTKLLENAVQKENADKIGVYYWKKTEARDLFEGAGVQFSGSSIQDGLIHSIHDAGSPVNVKFMEQTETKQFKRWFGNSQIVNEDGSPKVMYHGTASEFWSFDKKKANDLIGRRMGLGAGGGKFYLTEYKGSGNAAAYRAQQAGKGNQPNVMELYVSAQKVMDRDEYNRRLTDLYAKYPNSDPRGAGYDYRQRDKAIAMLDKAIRKEGYDGVWDRDSGELFVYEPTQIKSAINNVGTFDARNPDIRYSLRETNENVQGVLRAQEAAIEQVKGHRITAMEADKLAGAMLKDGNSTYDRAELAQRIGATMDLMERGEGVSMEQIDDELNAIAEDVLAKSAVLDMEHEQRADPVRTYLKGTRIALTESQKQQAASMLGSYGNYRRALFGQAKLSQNGTPLDVVWSELSEMAPEWFPADASEGDMAALLLDGVNATKPVYQNMSGMTTEESAQWLAGQLMDHYLNLPGVRETAKSKKALGASVQEMRAALQSFEQAGEANFEKALRGIEAARKKSGDEAKIAEVAEMRRLWEEWKQERAAQSEERFQRKLAEYKGKLRRDDAAMRRLYVEVLQRGYRMQQQMDNETRKEREALRLQRGKLERTTRSLLTMLEKPTDTKHVPGPLMKPLQDVLDALDFSGKQTKISVDLSARIEALADGMENSQEGDDPNAWQEGILLDRDKQVIDELRRVAQLLAGNLQGHSREGRGVYDLNSQTLKELNKWLGVVHHCIVEAGKMHGSNLPQSVQETAEMSKAEMSRKKPLKDKTVPVKMWNKLFGEDMMDSFTFFERLGPTANAVFHGLREGFDKNVQLIREAEKATREILSGLNLRELSGKHAKKQKFTLADGAEVELTKANVMELYVLSRRQQAMGHLLGEGIRVVGSEDVRSHKLTQGIIAQIVGTLTAEERIAAEKMQEFLAQKCGAWGNKASRVLLGYDKYTEKYYWPIPTDPNSRGTLKLDQNYEANIAAIKNQSHTKALTENATNAIMLGDIFNAYTRHISSMAAYSAYVVPISDFTRWYNSKGVKTEIQQLRGGRGTEYINTFLMALNGSALRENDSGVGKVVKWLNRNAKTAAVGWNLRVVIQQPTSISRAAMYMSPKYLSKAITMRKPDTELVNRYCSIAQWKDWGFYETNIGPNLRQMLVDGLHGMDGVRDKSMAWAAAGDKWTMNRLWNACLLETKDMYPEIKEGTDEFYQQVGRRMSEIIDRTQVVDSVFHRSQMMRSKNEINQTLTNFMSEPTKTYNMLMSAVANYAENRKNPAAQRRLAKALGVWTASNLLTAAAASVIDTLRDGADEEEWIDVYLGNLAGNFASGMNPLGMLPLVKDVMSIAEGFSASRLDQQSIEKISWAIQEVGRLSSGEKSSLNLYGTIYKCMQAMSSITGVPLSNILREGNALFHTIWGLDPTKTTEANKNAIVGKMHSALMRGDAEAAAEYRKKLRNETDLTPKEIDTGLAVLLTQEPDMARAYELMSKGKAREADAIRQKYIAMGYPAEAVDKAIKAHAPKQEKVVDPEAQLNVRLYKTDDMTNVMLMAAGVKEGEGVTMGDAMTIMSELVADSEAQDPNKAVKSSVQSSLKPEYVKLARAGDPRAQTLGSMMTQVLGTSEETMYGWVTDSYADDLRAGVDAYDPVVAKRAVAELRGRGLDDSSIKGKLTKYRQLYIDAVKSGDAQKAKDIKKMLMGLGLKGKNGKALYTNETFEDWLK